MADNRAVLAQAIDDWNNDNLSEYHAKVRVAPGGACLQRGAAWRRHPGLRRGAELESGA